MDYSFAQVILIASNSDGDDTFWMQMLVLVVVAALLGVGGLIKTRASKLKERGDYANAGRSQHTGFGRQIKHLEELKDRCVGIFRKIAPKAIVEKGLFDLESGEISSQGKVKNLTSGMEMLELDFLLGIVEKPEGGDGNDVTMRKLSFKELVRRGQLRTADSNVLKVYAKNEGNLYGKDIQCAATKELAGRTRPSSRVDFESGLRQAERTPHIEIQMAKVNASEK